jgi:acyl dehydratase
VKECKEVSKPDRGVVTFEIAVRNQKGETVMQCEQSVLMMRRRA